MKAWVVDFGLFALFQLRFRHRAAVTMSLRISVPSVHIDPRTRFPDARDDDEIPAFPRTWGHLEAKTLFHDFILPPHTTITVVYPVKELSWYRDSSEDAVTISAGKGGLTLSPEIPLGDAFRRGWEKLPVELRLMVLSCLVPHKEPLSFGYCFYSCFLCLSTVCNYKDHTAIHTTIHPLLRSTPEIYSLCRQIYYSTNTFSAILYMEFRYPSRAVNKYITTLYLCYSFRFFNWDCLSRLAQGRLGFSNLKWLSILFRYNGYLSMIGMSSRGEAPIYKKLYGIISKSQLHFKCKGEVRLTGGQQITEKMRQELLGLFVFESGVENKELGLHHDILFGRRFLTESQSPIPSGHNQDPNDEVKNQAETIPPKENVQQHG